MDSTTVICWTNPFVISGVSDLFCRSILFLMENPVSSVDPDQMPHYVAFDLSLHCLLMTPVRMDKIFVTVNGVPLQTAFTLSVSPSHRSDMTETLLKRV